MTLCLVSRLALQGLLRRRGVANKAGLPEMWHGACTCRGCHPSGKAPPVLPHLRGQQPDLTPHGGAGYRQHA
jgi:hypothetical protein